MDIANKYRVYKDRDFDEGTEIYANLGASFEPNFYNRHTIQLWEVSSTSAPVISRWKGVTLTDRTLHEITITNNSNFSKEISFAPVYVLPDNDSENKSLMIMGPHEVIHFYGTASLMDNNLIMTLRAGSQSKKFE